MRSDRLRAITRPRFDETLYSAMARAATYLGSPPSGALNRAVFGLDLPVMDGDLPVGLDAVVESGVFGPADLYGAAHEWTMFPYYAHYVGPARAEAAMRVMGDRGRWPHEVLGSWSVDFQPPDRLRFCRQCLADMLEQHPDFWWRRVHQLPSVLVCPDHGGPLRLSTVDRDVRRSAYVPATKKVCPIDAPVVVSDLDPRVHGDLLAIARASDALLDRDSDEHPDDRRNGYLERLHRIGLTNSEGAANLAGLARAMDGYWGSTLDNWPGLRRDGACRQRWLGALLWGGHGSPPLHHLLLELMLEARLRR